MKRKKMVFMEDEDKAFFEEFERDVEKGLYNSSRTDQVSLVRMQHAARNTLAKNATVNFRINGYTLSRFKARAAEEGMPYQTLLSSLVHKYVSSR